MLNEIKGINNADWLEESIK